MLWSTAMKLGCLGCLGLTILLIVSGLALAALVFLAGNVFDVPAVKAPAESRGPRGSPPSRSSWKSPLGKRAGRRVRSPSC